MVIIRYLISFLIKNLKWFISIPLCVGLLVFAFTRSMERKYEASTTIYTGIVSGFSIDQTGSTSKNYFTIENALDNLKTIIKSHNTLEEVCLRLFAQSMIYGDLEKDNLYISSSSFRNLWSIVPMDVKALIDKSSIENTVMRLRAYKTENTQNFIYGLIYFEHPDYSVKALSKIEAIRWGNSDMLELKYSSYDPALAYQTVLIMSDIFRIKYRELQFSETNDVVGYFRAELARQRIILRDLEDSLMHFKRDNKIIEYDQQTREIASMDAELQKAFNASELSQSGATSALGMLNTKVSDHNLAVTENSTLMGTVNKEAVLVELISKRESMLSPDAAKQDSSLKRYRDELAKVRGSLNSSTDKIGTYETSADGMLSTDVLSAYLLENINSIKSNTEMGILATKRQEMDTLYKTYSVVGANLKRMEREIKVAEHSYLNVLDNLNNALQRQKNLQLSSASLQVITPAVFPARPMSSKSKEMVLLATFGALIFLVALFLFLDLIPSTLTYPEKAERLVGRKVLTSFPVVEPEKENEPLYQMSLKYLCKVISLRVEEGRTLVINMLSAETEQGKSYFAEKLETAFDKRGYAVKYICYNRDFDEDSRQYDLATSVKDLLTNNARSYDIVIVEHPALVDKNIPTKLLKDHCVNLLVCKSTEAWTQSNAEALNRIDPDKSINIDILLNGVKPQIMEGYVGLIPPVTAFRRFEYNLLNLNLRALVLDIFKTQKKSMPTKGLDDTNTEI